MSLLPPDVAPAAALLGTLRSLAWWRRQVAYLAAWLPLVLLYALLVGGARTIPTAQSIGIALNTVGWAAGLGLLVRVVARRVAPGHYGRVALVLLHVVGAALYTSVWNGILLMGMRAEMATWGSVVAAAQSWIWWQLFYGGVLYALIVSLTWKSLADAHAREESARRQEAESLRVRTELEVLRGRLDPHFLFNTLHSLTVMARHDAAATEAALAQLADLLRYVLDPQRGARAFVRLGDELAFVQSYLALESMRLGDRLAVELQVDPDALDAEVPSLLLQPLVENAVKHAIAPRAHGGVVRISARYAEAQLVLSVEDDSASALAVTAETTGTGVALATLRRRLALLYGAESRLEGTRTARGFVVSVAVPA